MQFFVVKNGTKMIKKRRKRVIFEFVAAIAAI